MTNRGITAISGVVESGSAYVVSDIINKSGGQAFVITSTEGEARKLAGDISFFTGRDVFLMPQEDQIFLDFEAKDNADTVQRLAALKALREDENCIVVAPASAAVKKTMPHAFFDGMKIYLEMGGEADPVKLRESLTDMGYERMTMVESRGQFSARGDIIDVFPPEQDHPFRIEFYDTEVDSIRSFDVSSQRSIENVKTITLTPAGEMPADNEARDRALAAIDKAYKAQAKRLVKKGEEELAENVEKRLGELKEYIGSMTNSQLIDNYISYFYDKTEYAWDYMRSGAVFVCDPDRITEYLDARDKENRQDFEALLERGRAVKEDASSLSGLADFLNVYDGTASKGPLYITMPFPKVVKGVSEYAELKDIRSRQMSSFNSRMDIFEQELKSFTGSGYNVTIVASDFERVANLTEFTEHAGFTKHVNVVEGSLSGGVDFPDFKICYISDNDIFAGKRLKPRKRRREGQEQDSNVRYIESFTDLNEGDYVVHELHGIGRFLGIQRMKVDGKDRDYLKIKYAGNDTLYVPIEQFDIVQKYIGNEGVAPKLNKLSGNEWKAAKARARASIKDMADELIKLYAERESREGFAFDPDGELQREFENSFPYVETNDQLKASAEIKRNMEEPVAMDRLLCGDVGFGKTEVAARAICKCILSGKQAAMLVPTTLLANQHYYTLKERFSGLPCRVEMLSRFRTEKEQKQIVEDVNAGKVDLIIGTHRLLSKDIKYKDLGLLVIDEEQRFGVAHKEAITKLKSTVDVLTLSATPIPRTLNMSLSGIRDMSVLTEPPENRYPIRTYVTEEDDAVIREAITRELERGGQVFVIYNRVNGIQRVAERVEQLVPDARVVVGHGRMSEQRLEDIMLAFTNHESDVLVATTIVESGIDISNANTIIIMDSDRYGLAQLYQLRGRVGRNNRIAYAYLMYRKDKLLNDVARKRLKAIREFTEFGSGFKVAMRDLEIRGAGNLLGGEQSGHMMNIGYELYCKIIDQEVRKLKGESITDEPDDITLELHVAATIPDWYIDDESVKLSVYKKISHIRSDADEDDMYDELQDRFGDVPDEVANLMKVARIRGLSEELSISRIYEQGGQMFFQFNEKNPLNSENIVRINSAFDGRAFVHGGVKPFVRIPASRGKLDDAIVLLSLVKGDQ
ncbi:MAG: transcription-repair coupling factor [Eubacteriales bacterium]|nr:transcription-repair coupling factor [Eubacteriales bacterium]